MRIVITGATGFVGRHLYKSLIDQYDVIPIGHSRILPGGNSIDLSSFHQTCKLFEAIGIPDMVIHAAGSKDIERCETDPVHAHIMNVQATCNVIRAVGRQVPVIMISSDYVFSGEDGGYVENSPVSPRTAYGRSKVCAEMAGLNLSPKFIVMRISALYDNEASFPALLHSRLKASHPINCFTDAYYSPTSTHDFLSAMATLVRRKTKLKQRILHVCGPRCSRFEFAIRFAEVMGYDKHLIYKTYRDKKAKSFRDLSMQNELTQQTLEWKPTSHVDALEKIRDVNP